MNSSEYKIYHESFMKNNHGSNAVHTFFCIFFSVQCTLLCVIRKENYIALQLLVEYLMIVLPLILVHTLLAAYIYQLNAIVAIILLYNVINIKWDIKEERFYKSKNEYNNRLNSVTCIRGLTYLITGMAILAVDFKDFPRYLAKTEAYGYSLMDTGVGLFVLISGLVHRDFQKDNLNRIIKKNFKFISILLILGIGRYVSIKQLDYHEHVTEYGVHWNFFFTLAFCKVISTVLLLLSNNALLLGIYMIIMHELILYSGLEEWVFSSSSRLSLIDANREGISSILGYVSLYLFAVHLKNILTNKNAFILLKLITYIIVVILIAYSINLFRPTSRTLANAGYSMFLLTVLLTILTSMLFFERYLLNNDEFHFQPPLILSAINSNGLIYFLICNLLTGLINIMFQTLLMSSTSTFFILNIYMILTLFIPIYLNRKGIKT